MEETRSSLRAGQAVLGTEERDKMYAGGVGKKIDGAAALGIQAGVIGDQADMLAAQRREFFRFENVDAHLHAPGRPECFVVAARQGAAKSSTINAIQKHRRSVTREHSSDRVETREPSLSRTARYQ